MSENIQIIIVHNISSTIWYKLVQWHKRDLDEQEKNQEKFSKFVNDCVNSCSLSKSKNSLTKMDASNVYKTFDKVINFVLYTIVTEVQLTLTAQ